MNLNKQKGFIALMSAIIISAVLLIMITTTGLTGFYGRANVLNSEYKERSSALADACVDQAILNIALGVTFTGLVAIGSSDTCYIISNQADIPAPGQTTIKTRAIFEHSYTNLQVVVDTNMLDVVSWQELATLP